MYRIALTAAALGLTACATTAPYGGSLSAQDVNCGAGVLGGALVGGVAGNQIGKGQGQDLATIAGATVGGLLGATRRECQPQAYGGYRQAPVLVGVRCTRLFGPIQARVRKSFSTCLSSAKQTLRPSFEG